MNIDAIRNGIVIDHIRRQGYAGLQHVESGQA